tara:strand:- start:1472 stop:2197 length:726 start_codon:yes stop_codon:yes gene_type:complete
MKLILQSVLFFFLANYFTPNLTAQNYNHGLSLGVPGLIVGNINVGYEKVISENKTLALHIGVIIPREVPEWLTFGDETSSAILEELDNSAEGLSMVGEYRMYIGDKGAPFGFYVAPMVRYHDYQLTVGTDFDGETVLMGTKLNIIGLGLQLGTQFKLGDRMTLDWNFLGLTIDQKTITIEAYSNNADTDFQEIEEELQAEVDDLPLYSDKIELTSGNDFIKGKGSLIGLGLRSGLTIGYRF